MFKVTKCQLNKDSYIYPFKRRVWSAVSPNYLISSVGRRSTALPPLCETRDSWLAADIARRVGQ